MLRPAALALSVLALSSLLAPLVEHAEREVERLDLRREFPWELWTWRPPPPQPSGCGNEPVETRSEITRWPRRILKDAGFELGGEVVAPSEGGRGVPDVRVDVYLNETKEEPGVHLGSARTDHAGRFRLAGAFPHELRAERYHLVAHAHERSDGCKRYEEHWSDPEMDVLANTELRLVVPRQMVVGREAEVSGRLLDSVGAPVADARVVLKIGRERSAVETDAEGRFSRAFVPERTGKVPVIALYAGDSHYGRARVATAVPAREQLFELDGLDEAGRLVLARSEVNRVGGALLETPAPGEAALLDFEPLRVQACPECPPAGRVEAPVQADGAFQADVWIPGDQPPGPFRLRVHSDARNGTATTPGVLLADTILVLSPRPDGPFRRGYAVEVHARDDAGEPLEGEVSLRLPDGRAVALPIVEGVATYRGRAPCGDHELQARYAGAPHRAAASQEAGLQVCPLLAWVPAPLLDVPWWAWILVPALLAASWAGGRRLLERRAPALALGPPLEARVAEPDDEAPLVVGLGERVVVHARLPQGLPAGARLRAGAARELRPLRPDAEGQAAFALAPDALGELPVRVEVLNAQGRVVTRRTLRLRVVRYAEEVERRYVALRGEALRDRAPYATAGEFERWLRRHAPDADPEALRRLVRVFEEADYGPRDVRRGDFLAYLRAEAAFPRVDALPAPHAPRGAHGEGGA